MGDVIHPATRQIGTRMAIFTDNTNGGVDIDLDPNDSKTKWLLAEGYVAPKKTSAKDAERGIYQTSVAAKDDPTLAINRENPTPVDEIKPHVANDDVDTSGETVHGSNMGLEAEPVGNTDQAPKVKFTSNAKAGQEPTVDAEDTNSLKAAIDKEQGEPPLPGKGKAPAEVPDASLKAQIDKAQPATTANVPA